MIEVPELLARVTSEREGEAGRDWLRRLPRLADELLMHWDCRPAGVPLSGRVGLVLPVRRTDGTEAVLKISFPHPGNVHEPDAYAVWQGHAAVRLRERDDARFAMLLERAGRRTLAEFEDVLEAFRIAGALSRRLAVPAPPDLPRVSAQAPEWEKRLQDNVTDIPKYVADAALASVRELAYEQPETMIHGDFHFGNILESEREPWLVVDPKGMVGDPAFDAETLIVAGGRSLLRESDIRSVVLRRLAAFTETAEVDRERTRRLVQAQLVLGADESVRSGDPEWISRALGLLAELLV